MAAKAAVSLALVAWLLTRIELAPVAARLGGLSLALSSLALVALAVQLVLIAWRWRRVAAVSGVALGRWTALRLVAIGAFFNQALPSAIGGDAVRVWLVTLTGVSLGKAISIVLCDRVLGFVALLVLVALTLPLFEAVSGDRAAKYGLAGVVVGGACALVAFLALGRRLAAWLGRWRAVRALSELAADFQRLFALPGRALLLVVLAVLIHLLSVAAVLALARALGLGVGLVDCLVLVPPIVLVTMLPISIAGWGVREGAMVVGFGLAGVAPADALALALSYGLAVLAVGLPGGLLWLTGRPPGAGREARHEPLARPPPPG
ncbi:MAG: lysylphosphatidylglycerol synthase transmembrane domain-containing protein [Pseudomonadota bacterium]